MFIIVNSISIAGLSNLSTLCVSEKNLDEYQNSQQTLLTTGVFALLLDFNQNQVETFIFYVLQTLNITFAQTVSKKAIPFLSCLSDCHRRGYPDLRADTEKQPSVATPKVRPCLHMHVRSKTA